MRGPLRVRAVVEAERTMDGGASAATVSVDNSGDAASTLIIVQGNNRPGGCCTVHAAGCCAARGWGPVFRQVAGLR